MLTVQLYDPHSFIFGTIIANKLTAHTFDSPPFGKSIPVQSSYPTCIISMHISIFRIYFWYYITKIIPLIIHCVSITVVDDTLGPFPRHPKPDDPMILIHLIIYGNNHSSFTTISPFARCASHYPVGAPAFCSFPCEQAGIWIIV